MPKHLGIEATAERKPGPEKQRRKRAIPKRLRCQKEEVPASHIPSSRQSVSPLLSPSLSSPSLRVRIPAGKAGEISAGQKTQAGRAQLPAPGLREPPPQTHTRENTWRTGTSARLPNFFHVHCSVQIHVIARRGGVAGLKPPQLRGKYFTPRTVIKHQHRQNKLRRRPISAHLLSKALSGLETMVKMSMVSINLRRFCTFHLSACLVRSWNQGSLIYSGDARPNCCVWLLFPTLGLL